MADVLKAGMAMVLAAAALTACRDPARTSVPQAAPAAAQGPVNPDPGLTRYTCRDGQAITAGYPDRTTAVINFRDHSYTLKLAPSAGGARYVGFGLQWWVKGGHAAVASLKPGEEIASGAGVDCSEALDRAAARI